MTKVSSASNFNSFVKGDCRAFFFFKVWVLCLVFQATFFKFVAWFSFFSFNQCLHLFFLAITVLTLLLNIAWHPFSQHCVYSPYSLWDEEYWAPMTEHQSGTAMQMSPRTDSKHIVWLGMFFLKELIRPRADYTHVVILLKCIISSIFFSVTILKLQVVGGKRVAISKDTMRSLVIHRSRGTH